MWLDFIKSKVRMPDGKTQYDRLVHKLASALHIDQEMIASQTSGEGRPADSSLSSRNFLSNPCLACISRRQLLTVT
jgi:hypothetical protein